MICPPDYFLHAMLPHVEFRTLAGQRFLSLFLTAVLRHVLDAFSLAIEVQSTSKHGNTTRSKGTFQMEDDRPVGVFSSWVSRAEEREVGG